jgi:hypothetical protein
MSPSSMKPVPPPLHFRRTVHLKVLAPPKKRAGPTGAGDGPPRRWR